MIRNWTWDDTWAALLLAVIFCGLVTASQIIYADKAPAKYYVDMHDGRSCIKQATHWYLDETSFCSDDIDKVLEVLQVLNSGLKIVVPPGVVCQGEIIDLGTVEDKEE